MKVRNCLYKILLTKSVVRFFSGPNNLVFSFGTREKYLVTSGVLPQINMRFVSFLVRNTTIVITDVVCQAVCVPEMSCLSISFENLDRANDENEVVTPRVLACVSRISCRSISFSDGAAAPEL